MIRLHHPLQKVPVVGDHNEAPPEPAEPVLQPGHHLAVQVVGGLVQDEHVRWGGAGRRPGATRFRWPPERVSTGWVSR